MMLLGLSALVLGIGLQAQPQTNHTTVPAAAPVTEVIVMAKVKPEISPQEINKLVPDEVRAVVRLYLEGKIEQWYVRSGQPGAILFLRAKTVEDAKAILSDLPLIKADYLNVEYIPIGPLMSLGLLIQTPQPQVNPVLPH